jgi:hypothetical protein
MMSEQEDKERAYNSAVYKVWATDEEMKYAGPIFVILIAIVVIGLIILLVCDRI